MGGNCIVTSMPIPLCKSTTSNPTETVTSPTKDLGNVSCTPSQRGSVVTKVGFGSSPLRDTMTNGA
ncbi:hypothetical protein J5893_03505 [bacterium]|nr:hypothetical protein [bacterium]